MMTHIIMFFWLDPEIMPVTANIEYMAVYNVFPILEHIMTSLLTLKKTEITITGIRESAFHIILRLSSRNQSKQTVTQLAVGHLWITLT